MRRARGERPPGGRRLRQIPAARVRGHQGRSSTLADATGAAVTTAAAVTVPGGHDFASGGITFVNAAEGYLRVGGAYGVDASVTLVRLNDPTGLQSTQTGTGCGREGNCSPDGRFRIGVAPPTVAFTTGRPACMPGPRRTAMSARNRLGARGSATGAAERGPHRGQGSAEVVDGVGAFFAERVVVQASRLVGPDPADNLQVCRGTLSASPRSVAVCRPVSECAACTGFDSAEPRCAQAYRSHHHGRECPPASPVFSMNSSSCRDRPGALGARPPAVPPDGIKDSIYDDWLAQALEAAVACRDRCRVPGWPT